jgi:bacillolysin
MSRFNEVICCTAAVSAALFLSTSPITGQSPGPPDTGHTLGIHADGTTLPAALMRMDTMLSDGTLDIESTQQDTMIPGRVHERLKQLYKGVPVFGGQLVRQMDGRSIISLSGRIYDGIDLDVTPHASSQAAEAAARGSTADAHLHGQPALYVLPVDGGYKLAYRMEVRSDWDIRDVAVDAVSGALIYSRSQIETESAIGQGTGVFGDAKKMSVSSTASIYSAIDRLRPAWAFTLDFHGSVARLNSMLDTGFLFNSDVATNSSNVWTDGPTVDAHVYQGWVYDYYFKRHGRHGLDDHNLELDGIVHPLARSEATRQSRDVVGQFINNAFFCCDNLMTYGDGDGRNFTYFAGALDVVGHEMSHGVTRYSANLTYKDESGALNEAFSDIMGASIEFFYQPVGVGPGKADWLIGEDVTLVYPGYIRSLNNPNAVGDPDHYSLRQFIGTNIDNGGVHFNMTIATNAFYLAVDGGRNRVSGITVAGVGHNNIDRMEKIFYRGWVFLLGPNATFSDARAATLQAASDLYGSGSNERAQVAAAWSAVGVN